jgi:hypothetical protein
MTVAKQLSQANCDSATVPYYIGTACADWRTDATATMQGHSIAHDHLATGGRE